MLLRNGASITQKAGFHIKSDPLLNRRSRIFVLIAALSMLQGAGAASPVADGVGSDVPPNAMDGIKQYEKGVTVVTTITRMYSDGTSWAAMPANGSGTCGGNGWWGVINSADPNRTMYGVALAAYHTGKPVLMTCTTTTQGGGWSAIGSIYGY